MELIKSSGKFWKTMTCFWSFLLLFIVLLGFVGFLFFCLLSSDPVLHPWTVFEALSETVRPLIADLNDLPTGVTNYSHRQRALLQMKRQGDWLLIPLINDKTLMTTKTTRNKQDDTSVCGSECVSCVCVRVYFSTNWHQSAGSSFSRTTTEERRWLGAEQEEAWPGEA